MSEIELTHYPERGTGAGEGAAGNPGGTFAFAKRKARDEERVRLLAAKPAQTASQDAEVGWIAEGFFAFRDGRW